MTMTNQQFLVGGKYWFCPLLAPYRGPDSNKNTDINADVYHVVDSAANIAVISGAGLY